MKKRIIAISFLLAFLLVSNVNAASDFEVEIDAVKRDSRPSENAKFVISITNNAETNKTYEIMTSLRPNWEQLEEYLLSVSPGSTESANLLVTPPKTETAGRRGFYVYVTPQSEKNNTVEKNEYLEVVRDRKLILLSLSADKANYEPGEEVEITSSVKNVGKGRLSDHDILYTLGDMNETVNVPSIQSGGNIEIKTSFTLGKYYSGEYNINAEVLSDGNFSGESMDTKINVPGEIHIERSRNTSDFVLWKDVNLKIKNTGNIRSEQEYLEAEIPSYMQPLLSTEREASEINPENGKQVYRWSVENLDPGEVASVSYRFNYWIIIAIVGLVAIVVSFAYMELKTATIIKKTRRSGSEHSVHLIIENNTGKRIENVEVEDFVPGIAKLIEKFDSAKPNSIKKKEDGTELSWELGSIEPGEERVLMYKLKPVVQVEGYIKLPRAEITYETKRGEKKAVSHKANANFK